MPTSSLQTDTPVTRAMRTFGFSVLFSFQVASGAGTGQTSRETDGRARKTPNAA